MSSSINTVSSGANNRVSGLASGMDTESIVESMLAGTQSKIDKQSGAKKQLEWKQEIYRTMITNINTMGDKYFSFYGSENTNLMSSSLYNTMSGISSSSSVKVNSVAGNAVKGMSIDKIEQLATACTVKTAGTVTGNAVGGAADLSQFSDSTKTYSFSITLDGVNKTISFAGGTETEVVKSINQALYRNFGTSVGMELGGDGKMNLVQLRLDGNGDAVSMGTQVDSSRRVIIEAAGLDNDTIKNLGFDGGFSNKLAYGMALKDMNFAASLQGGRYEFEINGVKIQGLTGDSTLSEVISAINGSGAGVTVSYSSAADKFIMQSANTGDISNISMSQTYGNLLTVMFGTETKGIQSTLFSKDMETAPAAAGDDGLAGLDKIQKALYGGEDAEFTFLVDGEEVTITLAGKKESSSYKTRQGVIDAFQAQFDKKFGTGKIVLKMSEDTADASNSKLILSSEEHVIKFDNITGAAADLGFADGDNLLTNGDVLTLAGFKGDGTEKYQDGNGNVFAVGASTTLGDLMSFLSDPGVLGAGNVSLDDGRINIADMSGKSLSGAAVQKMFGTKSETEVLKFDTVNTVTSNALSSPAAGKIAVVVGGVTKEIDFSNTGTMGDLIAAINDNGKGITANFDAGNHLVISGNGAPVSITGLDTAGKALVNDLFGTDDFAFNAAVTKGQNAKIVVDGVAIERNNNTFEIDGITMELTAKSDIPINLTTSRDTDKIIDSLKSFVEDYNKLIEELNGYLSEESTYKKYPPLTDAQKKEMSDREVELWEEKSKQGLLRNDPNISSFLSDMRMVLYTKVDSAGLALYDIGIETSNNWRDNGKLVIDEDALRQAVTTNADSISKLFTDKEQGVAVKLQQAIKDAANISSGSPGSMVRYAGTKDVLVTNNTIYLEMKSISQTLANLNTKYSKEKERYWKQFTAMEQAISNMNSQSSWLTQQFSS